MSFYGSIQKRPKPLLCNVNFFLINIYVNLKTLDKIALKKNFKLHLDRIDFIYFFTIDLLEKYKGLNLKMKDNRDKYSSRRYCFKIQQGKNEINLFLHNMRRVKNWKTYTLTLYNAIVMHTFARSSTYRVLCWDAIKGGGKERKKKIENTVERYGTNTSRVPNAHLIIQHRVDEESCWTCVGCRPVQIRVKLAPLSLAKIAQLLIGNRKKNIRY